MEERKTFIEKYTEENSIRKVDFNNKNPFNPKGTLKRSGYILIFFLYRLSFYFLNAGTENGTINQVIALTFGIFFSIIYLFANIKRLRDIGWSAWFSLFIFIPVLCLGLNLLLAFKPTKIYDESKKYTLEDFKENLYGFSFISFQIAYIALGCLQFFATWAGMLNYFNNNIFVVFLISSFVSFIPLVGTGFGIYGAHVGWGWSMTLSVILFVFPYIFIGFALLLASLIGLFEIWKNKRNYEN